MINKWYNNGGGLTGESLEEAVKFDIVMLLAFDDVDEDVDAAVDDGRDVPHVTAWKDRRQDATYVLPALSTQTHQRVVQRFDVDVQLRPVDEVLKIFHQHLLQVNNPNINFQKKKTSWIDFFFFIFFH